MNNEEKDLERRIAQECERLCGYYPKTRATLLQMAYDFLVKIPTDIKEVKVKMENF